ncbi:hypothetical protein Lser_V15G31414 [Lactuca serriola]
MKLPMLPCPFTLNIHFIRLDKTSSTSFLSIERSDLSLSGLCPLQLEEIL